MTEPPMSAVSTLSMLTEPIPRSVALTTWVNHWLDGQCSADAVIAALEPFGSQRVQPHDDKSCAPSGLFVGLANLGLFAGQPTGRLRVVLPATGDPSGLPGPAHLNQQAISVGQVALIDDLHVALLPHPEDGCTTWHVYRTPPDLRVPATIRPEQASQAVNAALLRATAALTSLDIAAGRDEVSEALVGINQRLRQVPLPPGLDGPSRHTIHTAATILGICELARAVAPGATTTTLDAERSQVLNELSTMARHCLAAAGSPR